MNKKQQPRNKHLKRPKRQPRGGGLSASGQGLILYSNPFPAKHRVKLTYCELYSFTPSASALSSFFYYQTSLYDPRGSVGGHQPLYFDQLAAIYLRYRVIGVDYNVSVSTAGPSGGTLYFMASPTASFESAVETLEERPLVARTVYNGYGGQRTLRGSVVPWQVLGVTRQRYMNDDQFAGTVGSNPAIMTYMIPYVYVGPAGGSALTELRVEFVFHAEFFELARVGGS